MFYKLYNMIPFAECSSFTVNSIVRYHSSNLGSDTVKKQIIYKIVKHTIA